MKNLILLCSCALLFLLSCKKNQLGGTAIIKGTVVHHSKILPMANVYIKFKATEFPGRDSSIYDSKIIADQNGAFEFKCYKGDYYIYATAIDQGSKPIYVTGGVPVRLRNKETVQIEVPASEIH